jgi:hypothetical protein
VAKVIRAGLNLFACHCFQWAPQDFSKGLSDGIDIVFFLLNLTQEHQTKKKNNQANKQRKTRWMCPSPRAQTNRWESLTVATKGVTSSLQIK